MANLAKAIRNKRFKVVAGADVVLVVQARTGATVEMMLDNCSIMGLGASFSGAPLDEEDMTPGAILPPAKLRVGKQDIFLGRLVVRSATVRPGSCHFGFQTIDTKVPIDGPLSVALEADEDDKGSAYDYELDPDKFNLASFREAEQSNSDLFARCRQFGILYRKWKESPKYQYKNVRVPSKGPRVSLAATRKGGRNDYLIMGSNDYLGLAHHPRVLEAAKAAIDQYGFGSTGSAVTTGISQIHEELSDFVARLFRKEKAVLYNSGYAANIGAISGLTSELDLVVADILSHASIQDAMQMSRATSRFFKHNNVQHLDKLLSEERRQFHGALIVTEGVFSMDGDVAPMREIVQVAKKHNARTMIDEAHSFGVIGDKGLGGAAKMGVLDEVDLVMGTFSKICGGIGGFLAGSNDVVQWLYHLSRTHVFTVSIPPSTAAAALEALKVFTSDNSLLENLNRNIRHFVTGLRELGFGIRAAHESAVIPVVIGDEKKLGQINEILLNEGVFVVPIVYPAVSRKSCRFRFTMTAQHTISDLDFVLSVLEKAMLKTGFKPEDQQGANFRAA